MKFEKYFPLPWKSDKCVYLWSSNNQTPLMDDYTDYSNYDAGILDAVANVVNGHITSHITSQKCKAVYNPNEGVITVNDKYRLIVRGWGYLTSSGLSNEEAAEVQDEMGYWIADKLNGK